MPPQEPTSIPQRPSSDEIDLDSAIEQLRQHFKVPKVLVQKMLTQESGGDDSAVSPVGARSRWQIMPATAKRILKPDGKPIDVNDPLDAAYGGLKILSDNYKLFRQGAPSERAAWMRAVAAYHAGSGAVQEDLARGGLGIPDVGDGLINTQDHVYDIFEGTKPEDFLGEPQGKKEKVGVEVKPYEPDVTPITFQPDTSEPSSVFAKAAERGSGVGSPKLPATHPSLTAKPITATFDEFPENEDQVVDALMAQISPNALTANQQYRAETGRNLAVSSQPISDLTKEAGGKYQVTAAPTQKLIRFINAYNRGGLNEAESENKKMRDEEIASLQEQARNASSAVVDGFKKGVAQGGVGDAQFLYNISMLTRAIYTKNIYGTESPEYKALEKEDQDNQDVLNRSGASIGEAKTTTGQFIQGITGGAMELPQIAAMGGNLPLSSYVRHMDEGQVEAGKKALTSIPMQALLGFTSGATANLPRLAQEGISRGTVGTYSALTTSGGMKERAQAFATGAFMPVPMSRGAEESEPSAYIHAQFGRITESENQSGVPTNKIRVTDESGAEHVIIKPSTARNQRAIPLREDWVVLNPEEVAQGAKPKVGYRPKGAQDAETIRGNQGVVQEAGQVGQGVEGASSPNLYQEGQGRQPVQQGEVAAQGQVIPNERSMYVNGERVTAELTPENATKFDEIDSRHAAYAARRNTEVEQGILDRQRADKEIKGSAMRAAAEKRALHPDLETGAETTARLKKESTNYNGKPVTAKGQDGVVIGTAFGRVKVQLADGTAQMFDAEDVVAKPKADERIPVKQQPDLAAQATQQTESRATLERPANLIDTSPPARETVKHASDIKTAVDNRDVSTMNRLLEEAGITDADITANAAKTTKATEGIPERESQAAETSRAIPDRDSPTQRERSFPQTLEKAGLPTGSNLYYDVQSHAETLNRANQIISERGEQGALAWAMSESQPSAEQTAVGDILIKRLQDAGNVQGADDLASSMAERLTKLGQSIDAAKLVSAMSPDGILRYANKRIQSKNPEQRLSPDDAKTLIALAGDIKDSGSKFNEVMDLLRSLESRVSTLETIPKRESVKSKAVNLQSKLDAQVEAARARIKERQAKIESGELEYRSAGPTPTPHLNDYIIIGAAKLARKGIDLAVWTQEMVDEFGEEIRPHLQKIWTAAWKMKEETRKQIEQDRTVNRVTQGQPESYTPEQIKDLINQATDARKRATVARTEMQHLFERVESTPTQLVIDKVADVLNFPRAVMSSADVSAALRQGSVFTLTEFREAGTATAKMFRAFSNDQYQTMMTEMLADPAYLKVKHQMGVEFTSPELRGEGTLPEEYYASPLAEKIVPGVKRSEQAYTTYLDHARLFWGDKFGQEVEEYAAHNGWTEARTQGALKQAGKFINYGTGRGSLKVTLAGREIVDFTRASPILSAVFFAPRYLASRLQLLNIALNPWELYKLEVPVRKIVLRKTARYMATQAGIYTLASMAGAGTNATNPSDSDWLKIKIGNTRYDMLAGMQQPTRTMFLITKEFPSFSDKDPKKAEAAKERAWDALARFMEYKLAPVPSGVVAWKRGHELFEAPHSFTWKKAVLKRTVPLIMQDMYEAWTEEGTTGLGKAILKASPSAVGIGTQTYSTMPKRHAPPPPAASSAPPPR